jgi:hypothetical protein
MSRDPQFSGPLRDNLRDESNPAGDCALAAEFATAQDADGSWPVLMSIRLSIDTFAVPSAKGRTSATVSTYDGFHAFRHANAALMDRFSIRHPILLQMTVLANDVLSSGGRARTYRTYCSYCHFISCWEKAPRRKSPCHYPMFYSGLD